MARRFTLMAVVVATLLLPLPASGQGSGLFATFEFEQLRFTFHPTGLGKDGSGLAVFADDVRSIDQPAREIRACIDGQPRPKCPYGDLIPAGLRGDRDGTVTADEVTRFEGIAPIAVAQLPKVQRLSNVLRHNVTVDGLEGDAPRVVAIDIAQAEGSIESGDTVLVDVQVETSYANNPRADRHEIRVQGFELGKERFFALSVRWVIHDDKWVFRPAETHPEFIRKYSHPDAYQSSQEEFEAASLENFRLVAERERAPLADPDQPWLWILIVAGVLLVAAIVAVVVRRRRQ